MYSHFISYLGFCSTEEDQLHNKATCCLSYTVNIMPADAVTTLGARASAGMVLIKQARIFSSISRVNKLKQFIENKCSLYKNKLIEAEWHIWCVYKTYQHWFRQRLVAYLAPSHYLNQCCLIVNRPKGTYFSEILFKISKVFIQEHALENIVCKMVTILSRPQCVTHCGVMWHHRSSSRMVRLMACCLFSIKWLLEQMLSSYCQLP